jgi:hypothetical protein
LLELVRTLSLLQNPCAFELVARSTVCAGSISQPASILKIQGLLQQIYDEAIAIVVIMEILFGPFGSLEKCFYLGIIKRDSSW